MKKNIFVICGIIITIYLISLLSEIAFKVISDSSQIKFNMILEFMAFLFMACLCWYGFYTERAKNIKE